MRIGLTTKGVIASVSFTQAFENAFTRVLFMMEGVSGTPDSGKWPLSVDLVTTL